MTQRMKRQLVALLALYGVSVEAATVDYVSRRVSASTSPSFFRPRNISTDSTYELALANYNMFHREDKECLGSTWYVRPFYQQSFYGAQTARYFTPRHFETVTIAPASTGDIDPVWLQLISYQGAQTACPNYNFYYSSVSFEPIAQRYGAVFTANFLPSACSFFNINFALVQAKNDLRIIEDGRAVDPDVALAEQQPTYSNFYQAVDNTLATAGVLSNVWTAGRMACKKLRTLGVDDIQLKLGRTFSESDRGHFLGYLMMTIPTGKRSLFTSQQNPLPCAKGGEVVPTEGSQYLFQPLVGSRNWSFGFGLNGDVCVMQHEDRSFWLMYDAKFNYYFKATERRTFDLCSNGDWSRYLLLQTNINNPSISFNPFFSMPGGTIVPAVNIFTLDASVRPGAQVQLWTAAHYDLCHWQFEAGYNFWLRQQERVRIPAANAFSANTYGILDAGAAATAFVSQSQATIALAGAVSSDTAFVPVTVANLNPSSAAHPRTASSKLYGSVGYTFHESKPASVFLGINGSVEFAHNYAAMNQFAGWATAAVNF